MGEEVSVLLHGTLFVCIHSATNLPNMDRFSETIRQCLTVFSPCKKAIQGSNCINNKITSDPYVCMSLGDVKVASTNVISNETNPCWEQHFEIPVAHSVREIEFQVKDNDVIGADFIASVKIEASCLSSKIEKCSYALTGKDGKPIGGGATLEISLEYLPVEHDPQYKSCVSENPNYAGIPNTYFPLRQSGLLTLYQDADVPDGCLPEIDLDEGIKFGHSRCWADISKAIIDAKHLVYIAGWSIYTPVKLVRNSDPSTPSQTLGNLLKEKAAEDGVQVLLFVWDDYTSNPYFQNDGVMNTYDEQTRRFFEKSKVTCLLARRHGHHKISWFKKKVVETFYSHHKKIVLVDVKGEGATRHLVAFLGGLDLCKGRYDTPQHSLFANLDTTFNGDFYNRTFGKIDQGSESEGPRQPWHDLHCKIEGPAAYDVLKSFEQCWQKTLKRQKILSKLKRTIRGYRNFHFNVEDKDWHRDYYHDEISPKNWHIQVLRSIDSGSVHGFPNFTKAKDGKVLNSINSFSVDRSQMFPKGINHKCLTAGKNIAIDMGIHTAYIKAIRSAQHFIYIENQYFIGSSFSWPSYKTAGSNHLVPIEIALKIAKKIKSRQPFAVYIVIPMWPEGTPNNNVIQKMLFFQSQTMEMMYTIITNALKEMNLDKQYNSTDFLNFFCLGNRELKKPETLRERQTSGRIQLSAQKTRRFMIYVHSKGMIVDDEYLVMGSANINQRSMDGCRDTEIAIGAYQPCFSWEKKKGPPKGQIHGYRRSLWAEHLGVDEDCFLQPWTSECVHRVQELANENWKKYIAEETSDMKGHLMPYPIKVDPLGKIVALPGHETFPDVGGQIVGTNTRLKVPDTVIA